MTGTEHDHKAFVEGCYRCELAADEAQRASDHPGGHSWVTYEDDPEWEFCEWATCGFERRRKYRMTEAVLIPGTPIFGCPVCQDPWESEPSCEHYASDEEGK